MTANKPVTIANVIVLILASMVLAMKIRYK
jgi:uncharacterized protein with PQ loop repeat